jgi:cysteine desulfurase/selenocysteine lyase
MITPTPTSEVGGLDPAALTALANALFRTPPGLPEPDLAPAPNAVTAPGGIPPAGASNPLPVATSLPATPPFKFTQPAAAEALTPPSLITPRLVPTQAQTPDLPAFQSTVLPAAPRGGGSLAGVPEAEAALPPATPSPGVTDAALPASTASAAPPTSAFYFLDDAPSSASAPAGATAVFDPFALPTPRANTFPASSPTLPSPGISDASLPAPAASLTPPTSPFYFFGDAQSAAGAPAGLKPDFDPFAFHGLAPAAAKPAAPATAPGASSEPSYYFAEHPLRADAIPVVPADRGAFDVHAVRRDFPILSTRVSGGKPLVWLDNAATTQKPQAVIDRLAYFYANENSNIHRAAHELAARATDAYEAARKKVAKFIGASSPEEIVFVRGTTEAINLVAQSWGKQNIIEGDEIVISHLEHHANIVPWQMLAAEKGAKLRVIPVDERGQVRLDEYQKLLNSRTKIVSVTQVSNALGTVVPVKQIVDMGHRAGARVLIDGAQSVSHLRVDMQALDADFFVFSGHKIFGPTGIGVVYGKREVLADMPPYQGGGNMIEDVTFDKTTYHGPPTRFEAGTGNIADAVGLGAALDYVERIGIENIARYEHELLEYGIQGLCTVPGLRLIGTAPDKTSVMSFVLDGFSNQEVGQALSEEGIAVRTGHHCAQPILRRYGLESTVRPSLAFYNTHQEIDLLVTTLHRLARGRG